MTNVQLPALSIAQYAEKAHGTDRFASTPSTNKLAYGFFGEVGSLLSALKKVTRDELIESETEVAGEEIGDALWYLFAIANVNKIEPKQMGLCCLEYLRNRFDETKKNNSGDINFRQIDGLIALHGNELESNRHELLKELAVMSSEIVNHGAKPQLTLQTQSVTLQLGQLLGMLGLVCTSFRLKFEDIARDNLAKIYDRWPGDNPIYLNLFDDKCLEHEQLPRSIPMEFIEREVQGNSYVVQRLNEVYIGDRLTDNINEPDDYRFHDVFHLAYVAHLGWSPVIRALMKVKRKSKPKIDENEDGARAIIIEEGIATWIFNHAKNRGFYENVQIGKLDYGLLKQVQSMVEGYEVASCPLWQWERAILDGFRVFRELCKPENRGGIVTVDMLNHSLTFTALLKK
ncbi:MAG: nucleoside triphosphate pyrophosphohydrolase family protein [Methylophilaceae bacterium]